MEEIVQFEETLFEKCREYCASEDKSSYDKRRLDELFEGKDKRYLNDVLKNNYYSRLLLWLKSIIDPSKVALNNEGLLLSSDMDLLSIHDGEKTDLRRLISQGSRAILTGDVEVIDVEYLDFLQQRINMQIREEL